MVLKDAVVLVSSGDEDNRGFGTAFVIHREGDTSYLLTCAHVIRQTGPEIRAAGLPATVVADGREQDLDVAVLQVDIPLDKPVLKLRAAAAEGDRCKTAGFQSFENKTYLVRRLSGRLGRQVDIYSRRQLTGVRAWDFNIDDNYDLQPGYSGSPVVDESDQEVLGIISHRQGNGTGLALSVEIVTEVWPKMSGEILKSSSRFTLRRSPPRGPRMNLENELRAFEQIVQGRDTNTRLILIHGPSGMGKTWLLDEYELLARQSQWETLRILLAQQLLIEDFLTQVASFFNLKHFVHYDDFLTHGRPEPWTRSKETEWYRTLTHKFFLDLAEYPNPPRLIILFDQLEKADRPLKDWLSRVFLSRICRIGPLVAVVSGQEEIQPKPMAPGHTSFHLNGVEIDCFLRYVEERNASVEPEMIEEFHKLLKGEPKRFVDYVSSLPPAGGAK